MVGTLSVAVAETNPFRPKTAQVSGLRKFSIAIRSGKADIQSVRVTQGEQVEIMLASDQAVELHLHGYDLTLRLDPGVPAALSFAAQIAGRFPVESHRMGSGASAGRHRVLFYVDVYPR
jgi:hypothetical protein